MPDTEVLNRPFKGGGDDLGDRGDLPKACSTTPSPCVGKAMWNIQELMAKLDHWSQQAADQEHEISEERNKNDGTSRFDASHMETQPELCIEAAALYENETMCPFWKGTGGVLLEVVSLIKRLESDRREAKAALREERRKTERLRRKQDDLSLWKQQQFPIAVQLEYGDMAELRRHLEVHHDRTQQVRNLLEQDETQNRQLLENIGFVKKRRSMVEEKLRVEDGNTKRIEWALSEAREVHTKLSQKLRNSQQELDNDELQMDEEKRARTGTLSEVRTVLQERITELQQLKSSWDVSCARIGEAGKKMAFKEKQADAMLRQIPVLQRQQTELSDVVRQLDAQLQSHERILAERRDAFTSVLERLQASRHDGEANVCESEEIFSRKRQELLRLRDQNKEQDMDSEDYNKKISQSKQAVQQLQKDQKRLVERISQSEEQGDQAKGELTQHTARHTNTKARLEDLKQQTLEQEQSMREETEASKMQLTIEIKLGAVLKGNIASLTREYYATEADCEREKDEVAKEHEDATCTVAQLESELVTLREIHTAKSKKIEDLNRTLSDVLTAHPTLSDDLDRRKSACRAHLRSAEEAHQVVSLRREQVSRRIEALGVKCEEYRKESAAMESMISAIPEVLDQLRNESEMMAYKCNLISTAMSSLQSDAMAWRNRTALSKEAHSSLISQRQAVMQDLKANLRKALEENGELAQEYGALRKAVMVAKREATFALSERNRMEASFHDHTQLSLLQRRMHKAMLKYFKHRSVYSRAELARFQALSNQNKQKMKALQEELSVAIRRIAAFLTDATADEQRHVELGGPDRPDAYGADSAVIGRSPLRQTTHF